MTIEEFMIWVLAGLLGIIVSGWAWNNNRQVKRIDAIESRLIDVEKTYVHRDEFSDRFDKMEAKVEHGFEKLHEKVEYGFEKLQEKMDNRK